MYDRSIVNELKKPFLLIILKLLRSVNRETIPAKISFWINVNNSFALAYDLD